MSGIIFLNTQDLYSIKSFYQDRIGMRTWLQQGDCVILQHGNMLVGFCTREMTEFSGILTFFYETKEEVDQAYSTLSDLAESEPELNDTYQIYHFFARDPEGRRIEFQSFDHDTKPFLGGDELLVNRRSIRLFEDRLVSDEVLWQVFELCRWLPTSRNSQGYTYTVVRDREKIQALAEVRSPNSGPIGNTSMAVAVSTDPNITGRTMEDACIAAYHLTLAAKLHGLGTCWIADMDREYVKELLGIPQDHFVVTVTPLGYPAERPLPKRRREAFEFVRFVD
ncbi:MAG: nitroreductase [Anaerolineales bacterium]|nr:nitroreductase [Anaerolineales bacterium]